MPFQYKTDIIDELKKAGYTTYKIRNERIIGEGTLSKIRRGDVVSIEILDLLCRLLKKQPGDIIEYIE